MEVFVVVLLEGMFVWVSTFFFFEVGVWYICSLVCFGGERYFIKLLSLFFVLYFYLIGFYW